jgi:hypothetical protein
VEGSDRVSEAVAELYGAAPEEFTERRKALGAAARDAGDKAAAAAIAALRKPTRAAWAVNRLSRTDVTAPVRLKELADALRGAQRAMDGRRLRELSATRGPLIDELTQRALAAAGVCDPPPALRDEVAATLTAALADPDVAARFSAGTLTRAEHWSGFGIADVGIADPGTADPGTADAGTADTGTGSPDTGSRQAADAGGSIGVVSPVDAARAPARGDVAPARTRPRDSGQAAATSRATAREAARRQQQERVAREVAERAAQRREKLEDMERTVASASTAETEAITAEDRLAREVRDLEERLIRARAELANARLRARRAEAAARRARQTLDRLGHEPDTE